MTSKRRIKRAQKTAARAAKSTPKRDADDEEVPREFAGYQPLTPEKVSFRNWFVGISLTICYAGAAFCLYYYNAQVALIARNSYALEGLEPERELLALSFVLIACAAVINGFSFHQTRIAWLFSFAATTVLVVASMQLGAAAGESFGGDGYGVGATLVAVLVIGSHLAMIASLNNVEARRRRAAETKAKQKRERRAVRKANKVRGAEVIRCAECDARIPAHCAICKQCGWTYTIDDS